eukprot:gnl/TRDRNA2_/TRDRNA2_174975_c0_seq1.p1 gnl/TRDRNA2_/TRDRNA2_174975_c0~~gnl/TRDRNA2_/TRDRNA2_174975_c0_seq1.p1  ORF type:complete len:509 (-),score=68.39 gnl/TRDRNA2_/TRDRNA2_174975_c0_seq1:270-1796(-)
MKRQLRSFAAKTSLVLMSSAFAAQAASSGGLLRLLGKDVGRQHEVEGSTALALPRTYAPSAWGFRFYKPSQAKILGVGLENEDRAYFATEDRLVTVETGGLLSTLMELPDDDKLTAFHLCHHRGSLLYEAKHTTTDNKTTIVLYEYSLSVRNWLQVIDLGSVPPADSLACVDRVALRSSSTGVIAIDLMKKMATSLLTFEAPDGSDVLTSLSVAFASDTTEHAVIYAVAPHNHTLLKLRFIPEQEGLALNSSFEVVIPAGDGHDGSVGGPLGASALDPQRALWAAHMGALLFVDGCALRAVVGGSATTLLAGPDGSGTCVQPLKESVGSLPWNWDLSGPMHIAGSGPGTADAGALLVTGEQVLYVKWPETSCSSYTDESECVSHDGCGWAEGSTDIARDAGQRLCFTCEGLQWWSEMSSPGLDDICSLSGSPKTAALRYKSWFNLVSCGCALPPGGQTPDSSQGQGLGILVVLLLTVAFLLVLAYGVKRYVKRRADARDQGFVRSSDF